MSFELRALVGKRRHLEGIASHLTGARLTEELSLLPITLALESGFKPEERAPSLDGVRLSGRIEALAREASKAGAIAYVEADYSPGRDFQAAVLWRGGRMAGAPRVDRTAWDPREPTMTERPVNSVLRGMGVQAEGYGDEWDAVALARHPSTEDW